MAATHDPLTGLANRPSLSQAVQQFAETPGGQALAMLDIDYFLDVNTQFGHEVGDHLLTVLAGILQEEGGKHAYRISGDEFGILLPGVSLEQAFLRMEALRKRIQDAAEQFDLPDGRTVSITIGVAHYPRDARDARDLVKAADAALAAAKENGRNQVGLPPNEEMVMKSCYYPATSVRKLKILAERLNRKESHLLREALEELFRKHDVPERA